ncbi:MAG: spermidine synthase [Gammaproteobacteria bacterium]|nr:spermidine synthase [Gammaproteobacteria bacterium]
MLRQFRWLFALFALSGFAGIIYEALWSHYLKLFLGHAAYAQAAVLVLFMGGLSGGALLASRVARSGTDPLLIYAAVEIAIGILALSFHPVYVATIAAVQTWLPALNPRSITLVKFAISGALVLPQALLLGATFPLMATGILRRTSQQAGSDIAGLYFLNSLGAAVGVLATTFVLKPWLGLPGTLQLAGTLNFAVAMGVIGWWRLTVPASTNTDSPEQVSGQPLGRVLLLVAGLTGASSFIYEIVWIRMLSMVLGGTTHSFEIMLFTFIFGLALGGWWIRRSIDTLRSPLTNLALIQLAMAVFALTSLAFYDFSFDALALTLTALARTTSGYVVFMFVGVVLAMMIMLPTTICAGMALPIITKRLYSSADGERAVGWVYAANTSGAIVAVVFTQFVLIPAVGLRASLIVGAVIDLLLGVWLLQAAGRDHLGRKVWGAAFGTFAGIALQCFEFDPRKIASGVFRSGVSRLADDIHVDFLRDGKTATVAVFTRDASHRVIATNGKPDASMELNRERPATIDEATQVLSGVLPLAANPSAKAVAVIGIGSGMTTHVLLQSPHIERIDTIEIEAAMVEGARLFLPHVAVTFSDPRSRLVLDDARSYFAANQRHYDIIISEPSNPWVSGVAGLFTREFYRQVGHTLTPSGVFAQWMELYEISPPLVASVFRALSAEFKTIRLYEMGDGNLLLLAYPQVTPLESFEAAITNPGLIPLLRRIGIETAADLSARYVAEGSLLAPLFWSYQIRANSDFYPVLDEEAPKARFVRASATVLTDLTRTPWPLREMLGGEPLHTEGVSDASAARYRTNRYLRDAREVESQLIDPRSSGNAAVLGGSAQRELAFLLAARTECGFDAGYAAWRDAFVTTVSRVVPALDSAAGVRVLGRLGNHACAKTPRGAEWLAFYFAIARRDTQALGAATLRVLAQDPAVLAAYPSLLVGALLLDHANTEHLSEAKQILATLSPELRTTTENNLLIRLLHARLDPHE